MITVISMRIERLEKVDSRIMQQVVGYRIMKLSVGPAVIGRYCFSQITATHQAVCGHNYPEKGAIIIHCFIAVSRTRGRKIASRTINWRNPFLKKER
jgi:hypothetical protein